MIQNTKNTKKISVFLVLFAIGVGVALIVGGIEGGVNYCVGFLSFFCVVLSIFVVMKRKILRFKDKENEPNQAEEEEKIPFANKLSMGIGLSFSLFRLLSYGVLVFGLIALMEFDFFNHYAYFCGIFFSLFCVLVFLAFGIKEQG